MTATMSSSYTVGYSGESRNAVRPKSSETVSGHQQLMPQTRPDQPYQTKLATRWRQTHKHYYDSTTAYIRTYVRAFCIHSTDKLVSTTGVRRQRKYECSCITREVFQMHDVQHFMSFCKLMSDRHDPDYNSG